MSMPSIRREARSAAGLAVLVAFALVLGLAVAPAADAQVFYLTGKNLVPPLPHTVGTWASCLASVENLFPPTRTVLSISCAHNVANPVAAWVGRGREGQASQQELVFPAPFAGLMSARWQLNQEQWADLVVGNLHVVIASAVWPTGEVRGQIRNLQFPPSTLLLRFPLETTQLTPAPTNQVSGWCLALYDPAVPGTSNTDFTLIFLCTHDVPDVTGAELRLGARGVSGPRLVDLSPGSPRVEWQATWTSGQNPYQDLLDYLAQSRVYLLLRSRSYPAGVLRGQVQGCLKSPDALCLDGDRFRVTVSWGDTLGNQGMGQAVPVNADSGAFWFFNPNNLEMLVKVLDGCAVNGHHWVFSAATTNVAYTLHVEDTLTGAQVSYVNELGTPAVTRLDSTAFNTCP